MTGLLLLAVSSILALQSSQVDVPPIMRWTAGSLVMEVIPCDPPAPPDATYVCTKPPPPPILAPAYCLDPTRFALQSQDGKWHCLKFGGE